MKALFLPAICLLLSYQLSSAQKIRTVLEKPELEIETAIGRIDFKYLKVGSSVDFRPFCKAYALHPDEFKIEVVPMDSTIEVVPKSGKPGWYTLTKVQPTNIAHVQFRLYSEKEFSARSAFPVNKALPIIDEQGRLLYKNIRWGQTYQVGSKRILLDDIKFFAFTNQH